MKKVRYLAGAVGAVPVLGMMMPATATAAAAAAHPPKAKAKTVTLPHGAAARTAAGPAISAAGTCTGTIEAHPRNAHISTKFWYKYAVGGSALCIGTVEGHWFTPPNSPTGYAMKFRVRVYSGPGLKHRAYNVAVGADSNFPHNSLIAHQNIHKWFGASKGMPVQICTAWISTAGVFANSLWAGPQCSTFG